ncbi:aminoglycoside phosphotransferase family protein [Zhihengliuella salsuginis]|uniref:Phosphotransferase n=1 Tax=Zhihengliuella salsuginis TaxID=578222 RepID=A0ABQ3GDG0_9MICC|nr:aminoglycoside phosphotransferase family protein [Zhihengliuella salsuginis]GHD00498.1 putative phosphotransferase [Zhihengliuella salsuginis]
MAMHDDELLLDDALARRLIIDQFPAWREERIHRVGTNGTVNAIFRIGSGLAARFPLQPAGASDLGASLAREAAALRELAVHCPVASPAPVAVGRPGRGYPQPWSVQTWIPGDVATPTASEDSGTFARDLVDLIRSFRAADTKGRRFAGTGRGGELTDADAWMDVCFRRSGGLLPVDRLRVLWEVFRALPPAGPDVMTHGDLIPGNLLVAENRLIGVLDGGGFAAADPSLDLVAAWHHLDAERREIVRQELGCTAIDWRRGAAWAFVQAMGLVWYYRTTNPTMSKLGRSTLSRILDDPGCRT